jgi:hypothetical protein
MTHETAASAVPLLQETLGKVLQSASVIAYVSADEFETHSDFLTATRLGIYQVLKAIYAEHADLDPLAELRSAAKLDDPSELLVDSSPGTPSAEGALDPDTARRARTILEDAYGLLSQADVVFATRAEVETRELARLRVLCSEALAGIQSALRHLATELRGGEQPVA